MKTLIRAFKARTQEGFTLVELMVVVAIIGLLSAVAIPNFKKYQAKSKTSEAKLQLSALYTAEQSFYMDYDNYGTCLNSMGFDPGLEIMQRYYSVGFNAANTTAGALATANGAPGSCTSAGWTPLTSASSATGTSHAFAYNGSKRVGSATALTTAAITTSSVVNDAGQLFTAGAVGIISTSNTTAATADYWTINEQKRLTQTVVGF